MSEPALHLTISDDLFRFRGKDPITGTPWVVDLTPFVVSSSLHMAAGEPHSITLSLAVASVNRPEGDEGESV